MKRKNIKDRFTDILIVDFRSNQTDRHFPNGDLHSDRSRKKSQGFFFFLRKKRILNSNFIHGYCWVALHVCFFSLANNFGAIQKIRMPTSSKNNKST